MTGKQALAAVMRPGKGLVSEEVAAAIVRFVAGGAEIANAEVEPSLLSLICRELNDARIAQGRSEISLDLLAGSHATILSNFYERSLADQPPAVRRIIEDELLTESGFRENIAEERLRQQLRPPPARRPIRSPCWSTGACCASRSAWMCAASNSPTTCCAASSRPAAICATSARRARRPSACWPSSASANWPRGARWCAPARSRACCAVLAIGAMLAAVLAYLSTQRAHRAERLAEQTRAAAEQARAGAEHLLGYLTDDFARELVSFGRINVVAEFSQRQIDYFHSLPPALQGPETTATARWPWCTTPAPMRQLGDLATASKSAAEAAQLLEQLQRGGDHSEATIIALALAYTAQAQIKDSQNDSDGIITRQARRRTVAAVGGSAGRLGGRAASICRDPGSLSATSRPPAIGSRRPLRHSGNRCRLPRDLGAKTLADIDMAADYAEAGAWYVGCLKGWDATARPRASETRPSPLPKGAGATSGLPPGAARAAGGRGQSRRGGAE